MAYFSGLWKISSREQAKNLFDLLDYSKCEIRFSKKNTPKNNSSSTTSEDPLAEAIPFDNSENLLKEMLKKVH